MNNIFVRHVFYEECLERRKALWLWLFNFALE